VKLSPNVTSIARMARVAQEAGAQAVSLVNTFLALAIDIETRKPRIANVTGGLSGRDPADCGAHGARGSAGGDHTGGGDGRIVRAEDAVEFAGGATAVEVGTASFADPRAVENIANGCGSGARSMRCARERTDRGMVR